MCGVLVVKGKAGMGNRLLCVASASLYAELTHRELVIDWSDRTYSDDRRDVFGKLFASPSAGAMEGLFAARAVYPKPWCGRLDRSVDELLHEYYPDDDEADTKRRIARRYTVDLCDDVAEDVAVRWAWDDEIHRLRAHFVGAHARFASESDDALLRRALRERIRLAPMVTEPVEAFARANFDGPMIGVHVRFTDRKTPFLHYFGMIEYVRLLHPSARIFLATDNPRVEEHFRARYGDRVCTTSKWFPSQGQPIHRSHDACDRLGLAAEALVDMVLLSRCDFLVVNKASTFGKVAHLLADPSHTRTIDATPITVRGTVKSLARGAAGPLLRARHSMRALRAPAAAPRAEQRPTAIATFDIGPQVRGPEIELAPMIAACSSRWSADTLPA